MIAYSQVLEENKKRKSISSSTPNTVTTVTKGKPKPASKATPLSSSSATIAPQWGAREVIDEIPGPTPSATEVSVAEFMSQLDHSHHQGLGDLNFSGDDEVGDEDATEEAGMRRPPRMPPTRPKKG